jgi:hypothetical protein
MSRFMSETVADLRWGRESWRVFITLCVPAFAVAFAVAFQRMG